MQCPTAEEMRAHWEAQGSELKADPDCPDIEPGGRADATASTDAAADTQRAHDHSHGGDAAPTVITTMDQAQTLLDPEDDPFVVIDKDAQGRYFAIHLTPAPGLPTPPASIRTADQLAAWIAARERTSR